MIPLSVKKQNELLARELGYEEGHPRYSWVWSNSLRHPMVLMDDENQIIYDYFCACGRNMSVHSSTCTWTQPRQKWEMRSLCPNLSNQWVLCRWIKPEATRDDWERAFGALPYPADGYFSPVGDPQKTISIPDGQVPFRATTELCIQHIKDHFSRSAKQRTQDTKEQWEKNEKDYREELRLKCIDAFPVHEGFPGEKHGWSHGGRPDVASPNVRKVLTASEASAKPSSEPLVLAS